MMRRTGLVAAFVGAFLGGALLGSEIGCSSNNKGTPPLPGPGDAGDDSSVTPPQDASTTPDASDSGGSVTPTDSGMRALTCTAAPFVNFGATVSLQAASGGPTPVSGATVGFTTCPGFLLTSDGSGKVSTQITQNVPIIPIYSASGAVDGIGAEIPAGADVNESVALITHGAAASVPGITDGGDAPVLEITIAADPAATGACADVTGVSLSVTGHTEAVVNYMSPNWPTTPGPASTTSSAGPLVFISGITGASSVQLTGTKTGCAVSFASASQTGRFPVLTGSITYGVATLQN
ncbi:MAG TPA: hypothetical protein VGI39_29510 [Polyangiaceae bacterium]|jgi:hypothetical protein